MHFEKLKQPFHEDLIEWRIGQCGKNSKGIWANSLAYIEARAVMDRLDEVCGPENWQANYRFEGNGVMCVLSVQVKPGEWIFKEDGSDPSDIESFKGAISGALKRAAVLWGIGRYLYGLESSYVKIVDQSHPGAKWGRLKKEDGGESFYWLPPKLPAWAKPPEAIGVEKQVLKENSLDGNGDQTIDSYRIPFGKYAKRALEEIDLGDLRSYVEYIENKAHKDNKPLTGQVLDFVDRAVEYIGAMENSEPGASG